MRRVRLPQVIEDMKQLRTDVDLIKQSQFIGGDSLTGFITNSGNPSDISFSLAAGATRNLTVTFNPTVSTTTAIVEMIVFFSLSPNVLATAIYPWQDSTLNWLYGIQKLPPSGNSSRWFISVWNSTSSTGTAYLKTIFNATDSGTFTIA
jgi:hypothetical protein